ncbi:hypothetical protein F511_25495 [Dorcoceras hygrometricum]|uniref:Uncharacterized protein n=1 Tax=Dorcoceras hygrometricum TaxID=472368 RepID=A0A2Z7DDY3_9LAMI|nr:hypothetical protein F511_25495 [Dorcoceras hygrometricum]
MPPRVQSVYASPSLNYKITENRGENLAQYTHQSRRNLHRDKCPSVSRVKQRVQHRVKRSSPRSNPSINTQHRRGFDGHTFDFEDFDHPSPTSRLDVPTSRAPEVASARRLREFGYIRYTIFRTSIGI